MGVMVAVALRNMSVLLIIASVLFIALFVEWGQVMKLKAARKGGESDV
jgi:hypothetical protein